MRSQVQNDSRGVVGGCNAVFQRLFVEGIVDLFGGGGVHVIVAAALVTCDAPRQRVRIIGQVGRPAGGLALFDCDKGLPGPVVAILVSDRQETFGAPDASPLFSGEDCCAPSSSDGCGCSLGSDI